MSRNVAETENIKRTNGSIAMNGRYLLNNIKKIRLYHFSVLSVSLYQVFTTCKLTTNHPKYTQKYKPYLYNHD